MLPPNQGPLSISAPTPDYVTAAQQQQKARIAQLLQANAMAPKEPLTSKYQVLGNMADRANAQTQLASANAAASDVIRGTGQSTINAMGNVGGANAGAASVRNNNSGAQMFGPVAREFGATGSENLTGGNSIAHFNDPVDGAAAHIALLSRNYSGRKLDDAINTWSGGNHAKEYADYVVENSGLPRDTVITPQLMQSPDGIKLVKHMADWEADPRKGGNPLPMAGYQEAQNRVFGARGGMPTGQPPVPGGPVTRAAPEGTGGEGIQFAPGTLPHRLTVDPQELKRLFTAQAAGFGDPETNRMLLQTYMMQGQPLQQEQKGAGTYAISPDGRNVTFIPEYHWGNMKAGGAEYSGASRIDPRTGNQIFSQEPGTPPGTAPGPLGTTPPGIPSKLGQLAGFDVGITKQKKQNEEDVKALTKDVSETGESGTRAQASLSQLQLMRRLVDNKALYQGPGADAALDWNKLKTIFGSETGANAVSIAQAFDKLTSSSVIDDLKTQLSKLGQIRVAEIQLLTRATASRYNTQKANQMVLDLQIKAHQQVAALSQVAADYQRGFKLDGTGKPVVDENGQIQMDSVSHTAGGLQQAKLDYLRNNPMLDKNTIEEMNKTLDADEALKKTEGEGKGTKAYHNRSPLSIEEMKTRLRGKGLE